MRYALAPLRAVALLLHILLGIAIAFIAFPLCRRQATRNRINHVWSRWVLRLCGARLRYRGPPLGDELAATGITPGSDGRLLLSNHVSWIDIFAINAAMPCRFVAKAEIVRWPVLGGMVAHSGTLFIERGRRRAVATMNEAVQGSSAVRRDDRRVPRRHDDARRSPAAVSLEPAGAGRGHRLPGLAGRAALHGAGRVQRCRGVHRRNGSRHFAGKGAGRAIGWRSRSHSCRRSTQRRTRTGIRSPAPRMPRCQRTLAGSKCRSAPRSSMAATAPMTATNRPAPGPAGQSIWNSAPSASRNAVSWPPQTQPVSRPITLDRCTSPSVDQWPKTIGVPRVARSG